MLHISSISYIVKIVILLVIYNNIVYFSLYHVLLVKLVILQVKMYNSILLYVKTDSCIIFTILFRDLLVKKGILLSNKEGSTYKEEGYIS